MRTALTALLAIVAYCGDRGGITNGLYIALNISGIKCWDVNVNLLLTNIRQ
ncbi:hypothetical protein HUN01_22530 [Nostoc edaphicum CCNP1411]|uniref:Uncharacterized protein n=1 Tax=Nostoc edaphicum CCNP1411 TaxID=1472755 RepID=A0A7D7LH17_9NOSO|nr:hypothetical protein [Nostoc edaphicum]QMS90229.1 hypothetical protein HUN01_22530 [Nostoc edaphicum CCNP1411]